jgi:hypothetical protein
MVREKFFFVANPIRIAKSETDADDVRERDVCPARHASAF